MPGDRSRGRQQGASAKGRLEWHDSGCQPQGPWLSTSPRAPDPPVSAVSSNPGAPVRLRQRRQQCAVSLKHHHLPRSCLPCQAQHLCGVQRWREHVRLAQHAHRHALPRLLSSHAGGCLARSFRSPALWLREPQARQAGKQPRLCGRRGGLRQQQQAARVLCQVLQQVGTCTCRCGSWGEAA
jgi:hypothetical protein